MVGDGAFNTTSCLKQHNKKLYFKTARKCLSAELFHRNSDHDKLFIAYDRILVQVVKLRMQVLTCSHTLSFTYNCSSGVASRIYDGVILTSSYDSHTWSTRIRYL